MPDGAEVVLDRVHIYPNPRELDLLGMSLGQLIT